ncbi:hypothetical protein VI817_003871 [Penicillium citrinum]|nr:hypothetical protein VI817_003871 [Penicillium citrinum]
MERDKRVGAGHWKGCHTFTDILGDGPGGSSGEQSQWRTGGLKMGATYWYYVSTPGIHIQKDNHSQNQTVLAG